MTVVGAVRLGGTPALVGDAVVSKNGSRVDLIRKVYVVCPNLAIGWAGMSIAAEKVVRDLHSEFAFKRASRSSLERFLASYKDWPHARLVGWIVDGIAYSFLWNSSYPESLCFYENDDLFIGNGADWLRAIITGDTVSVGIRGLEAAAFEATLYVATALVAEALHASGWEPTWGYCYDIILLERDGFVHFPSMTFMAWDFDMSASGELRRAAPMDFVMKYAHVHECSTMQMGTWSSRQWRNNIARPIHKNVELAHVDARPFWLRSVYYGYIFRFFSNDIHQFEVRFATASVTEENCPIWPVGDFEKTTFEVKAKWIEKFYADRLEEASSL